MTDKKSCLPALTCICAGLSIPLLIAAQYLIWKYAPVEMTMGLLQKIFYFHLPMAWWGMFGFFLVFVGSIGVLWRKTRFWHHLAGAAAELGVLFSSLALISGSLWARAAWNVWWTWDPRLTTTLIMWFVYCAYLILRQSEIAFERKSKLLAVLGIVAFLDVPLVFLSARMWRSIHPAVLASKSGGLEPEMQTTVLVSIAAFGLLWLAFLFARISQLNTSHRFETLLDQEEE